MQSRLALERAARPKDRGRCEGCDWVCEALNLLKMPANAAHVCSGGSQQVLPCPDLKQGVSAQSLYLSRGVRWTLSIHMDRDL